MARSLSQQLQSVQNAIEALESGKTQSYEIEGRKLTYIDLQTLYKREEELIAKIEKYGGDYIPGVNTRQIKRKAKVVFK